MCFHQLPLLLNMRALLQVYRYVSFKAIKQYCMEQTTKATLESNIICTERLYSPSGD